jgi:hypothetical protein
MNPLLSALLVVSAACRSAPAEPRVVFVQDAGASVSSTSGEGYTQLTVGGDAGDLLLVLRGERATALLDGEVLPPERIRRDGDRLSVLGAGGEELYAVRVLDGKGGLVYPYDARVVRWADPQGGLFGYATGAGGTTWHQAAAERRKLIGVSTSPADAALRAQLGVAGDALVIESVNDGMPAQKAGMQPLDVVVAIEGRDGATTELLREVLAEKQPGETLVLSVRRQGQPLELPLVIEEPRETGGTGPWSFVGPSGEASEYFKLSQLFDERADQERQLEELSTALARVRDEQAALAAAGTVESARRAAELAEKQALLAAELARREALSADSAASRMALLGDLGARTMVVPSWSAGVGAAAGDPDRLARLEERLARLEELLEKLADGQQAGATHDGEGEGGQP